MLIRLTVYYNNSDIMPYKDPEKQREVSRRLMRDVRVQQMQNSFISLSEKVDVGNKGTLSPGKTEWEKIKHGSRT